MDAAFYNFLENWAQLESAYTAAKGEERDDIAFEMFSAADETLCQRPASKAGAMAQLRFCALYAERWTDEKLLAGALQHILDVLGRTA